MSMVPTANPFEDSPFTAMPGEGAIMSSQFDWKETPEAHVLQAEVPGLKKEEMKIEVEDGRVLQVSGERQVEKQEDNEACHRVERSSCKFKKCFTLPTNAKLDQMKASMENGVLTITLPKITDVKAIENAY